MGHKRSSLNRINGKGQNSQREVRPEVFKDNVARNQLINNKEILEDDKRRASQRRTKSKYETKKEQSRLRLYGKRSYEKNASKSKEQSRLRLYGKRSYEKNASKSKEQLKNELKEKQLGIPTLNRSIIPGFQVKKGKKGKKLVKDDDSLLMNRIIKSIGDEYDNTIESKLEKDKRLQEIRELKRQEIEKKENEKKMKLEDKKMEIKNKSNMARSLRRKNKRLSEKEVEAEVEQSQKKKKSVSFA